MPRSKAKDDPRGNPQATARVPEEVWERLGAVVDAMNEQNVPGTPTTTRNDVVRAAILEGLPVLEKRLGIQKGGKKTPRKA